MKDTLAKHLLRANYQCAIWKVALQSIANSPPPSGHGYTCLSDFLATCNYRVHGMCVPTHAFHAQFAH